MDFWKRENFREITQIFQVFIKDRYFWEAIIFCFIWQESILNVGLDTIIWNPYQMAVADFLCTEMV